MFILVSKSLPFQLLKLHIDQSGRYVILHARLRGIESVIRGVYVPPPFQRTVLDNVIAKISLYPTVSFILLGDYNFILDPLLDRLQPPLTHNKALSNWAGAHGLTEAWRWFHCNSKQCSCFSPTNNFLSCIDLALVSMDLLAQKLTIAYLPTGISDHAPLLVGITQNVEGPSRLWRLNSRWLEVPSVDIKCHSDMEEYWAVNEGTSSPSMEWEAFKAVMRGSLVNAIAVYRAQLLAARVSLEKGVTTTEAAFVKSPVPENRDAFKEAQKHYTLHLVNYTQKKLLTQRQTILAEGDKNGRASAFFWQGWKSHTQ